MNNKAYLPHINTGLWTVNQANPEVEVYTYTQGNQTVTLTPKDKVTVYLANQSTRLHLENQYRNNFERNLLPDGLEVGQE